MIYVASWLGFFESKCPFLMRLGIIRIEALTHLSLSLSPQQSFNHHAFSHPLTVACYSLLILLSSFVPISDRFFPFSFSFHSIQWQLLFVGLLLTILLLWLTCSTVCYIYIINAHNGDDDDFGTFWLQLNILGTSTYCVFLRTQLLFTVWS